MNPPPPSSTKIPGGSSATESQAAPQVAQIAPVQTGISHQDVNLSYPDDIKAKILHLLSIYPVISPSMLQIGIGSSLPAKMWRPLLQGLIREGKVKQDVYVHPTATGRQQSYTLISLVNTQITFPA